MDPIPATTKRRGLLCFLLFKIKVSVKLHYTLSSVYTVFVGKIEASNSSTVEEVFTRINFWDD